MSVFGTEIKRPIQTCLAKAILKRVEKETNMKTAYVVLECDGDCPVEVVGVYSTRDLAEDNYHPEIHKIVIMQVDVNI